MNNFDSQYRDCAPTSLPAWSGVRVMMMPYIMRDPIGSLPEYLWPWAGTLAQAAIIAGHKYGVNTDQVGYLTIDEAMVKTGETHRRPGLHVDGVGPDGKAGGWGGGGGWGSNGMLIATNHVGSCVYPKTFEGWPKANGDCEHLRPQLSERVDFLPNRIYYLTPMTVHESLPMKEDVKRQFLRVSFPSDAPWYEGYTENPKGIKPTGPIHPARAEYMAYRP